MSNFMKQLDANYRRETGLEERRYYSIFYSRIVPSDVVLIGWNPCGNPETWDPSVLASQSWYENGEHEVVDTDFPNSVGMREFLVSTGIADDQEEIRSIPKTNLIFRRSRDQNSLGLPAGKAAREAQKYVERILSEVQPELIVCEGKTTLEKFEHLYCSDIEIRIDGKAVYTPNGRSSALIYRADKATVNCLGQKCHLIGIGHPSKYATRAEWRDVLANSKAIYGSFN